jgi:hypothetical protein
MLGVVDPSSLTGMGLELLVAGAVIVVVRLFLNHLRETRLDMKDCIDRNSAALAHNSEAMDRMSEVAIQCRVNQQAIRSPKPLSKEIPA